MTDVQSAHAEADAPGRVNVLGEHTDYNGGFVLPTAIPQRTRVRVHRARAPRFTVLARDLNTTVELTLAHPPEEPFAKYVYGCLKVLEEEGFAVPPLHLDIHSEVPIGVGLSSSAALEVAVLRAVRALLHLDLDDVALALCAQRAEVEFAGVRCGIMDQMASSLARLGQMLFLDTRTLERRHVPMPHDTEILVLDSGVPRSLANTAYNTRREECERAARLLRVKSLRDVADVAVLAELPPLERRRARHVITENARVLSAAERPGAAELGALMRASHESLRQDFEVSVPELDALVAILCDAPGVYGARLTGAGFGGACVALCEAGRARALGEGAVRAYASDRRNARILVPPLEGAMSSCP